MSENGEPFTTRMRKATRKIHSVSDALVNAKFAISLKDEAVWSGGLFVFYNVFGFLEDAQKRLNMPEFNMLYVHPELYRKKAFEKDLNHYLGDKWRTQERSPALQAYIQHLETLEKEKPLLLLAYAYHLYMGLLSGGQIIAKKRKLFGHKTNNPDGYVERVMQFKGVDISELKARVRAAMNEVAGKLTDDEREQLVEESTQVFLMNNMTVNSIEGQDQVLRSILYKVSAVVLIVFGAVLAYKMRK